jgi:asparagine synthase (glutamine-hydrolysing)
MCSSDGRHAIIFNGEIYNYLELRRELQARGRSFRSRSDTEVLLAALDEWGTDCLGRLVGMFAFAWADLMAGEVLLARDPFGIKPLYLAETTEGLAFASEIPALLALTQARRQLNAARLGPFLRYGLSDVGEGTLFAGVRQVPAAHWVRVRLDPWDQSPPRAYWNARRQPQREITAPVAAAELREAFCESVRLHLRSDVPVGAALSGGIDSSAIVAVIRHVAGPGAEIHAFSFIPDDEGLSEERWIRLAAERAGATVHAVRPTAAEVAADLSQVIRSQGEPFGSPSIYAQYRVFRLAAENGIKVMLNGQGADELLAGYRPYIGARIAGLIRRGKIGRAAQLAVRASGLPGLNVGTVAMLAADYLIPAGLQAPLRRLVGRELIPDWMDGHWFNARGGTPVSSRTTADREVFWAEMERALGTSLPRLLRYDDRNSMAASIESRVPFLTVPLLNLCWSLPEEYLLDDAGTSKRVFRDAMRGLVPDAILNRQDKIGFVAPVAAWMAAERKWVDGLLDFAAEARVPGIRIDGARRAWSRAGNGDSTRISGQLWRCLSYLEWVRQFAVEGAA